MSYLPNAKSKPLNRLSIFHSPVGRKKQNAEALELIPFLLHMDQQIQIDDVRFGGEPPDFVFVIGGKSIGLEMTTLNPVVFEKGGNQKREIFRKWQAQVKANPKPVNVFEWGTFTLRESLASLRKQFLGKAAKADRWRTNFDSAWLLIDLMEGSPFGELAGSAKPVAGHEAEFLDHQAKVLFEVCVILADQNPFDCVFMFAGCQGVCFPTNGKNPHRFPMPRWDVVARGAKVDDSHLNWTNTLRHVNRTGTAALSSECILDIASENALDDREAADPPTDSPLPRQNDSEPN